ncbi:hypothetical protein F5Y10DRAFT_267673 [Nemania abortiva]|nr:hypothetical protein F5Y10DRAFT_267673 [Nemania abortiva]
MDGHHFDPRRRTRRSVLKSLEISNGKQTDADAPLDTETRAGRKRRARNTKETSPPKEKGSDKPSGAHCPPTDEGKKRLSAAVSDGTTYGPQLKRARLTRKNLTLFTSGTGATSVSESPTSDKVDMEETTSTTLSGFVSKAIQNGIVFDQKEPPVNLDEILSRCLRRRRSIPAADSDFEVYRDKVKYSTNESTIVADTSWMLLKQYPKNGSGNEERDADKANDAEEEEAEEEEENNANRSNGLPYLRAFNQKLMGLPKDAGLDNGLGLLQPGFIEGLNSWEFHPVPIHSIRGAVLCPGWKFSIALPHIAGEWKRRMGNIEEAEVRSAYDGAALVFARTEALKYLGELDPPRHARVITFTSNGTNLHLFAHYASVTRDKKLEYHQHLIASQDLTTSYDGFEAGRRMLRNAQDYAKRQSEILKNRLRNHTKKSQRIIRIYLEARETSATDSPRPRRGRPPKQGAPLPDDSKPGCQNRGRETSDAAVPKRKRGRPPTRDK